MEKYGNVYTLCEICTRLDKHKRLMPIHPTSGAMGIREINQYTCQGNFFADKRYLPSKGSCPGFIQNDSD